MKIAFGCDHRGFHIKDIIIDWLKSNGHDVTDVGAYTSDRVDYAVYGEKAGRLVASGACDFGVLVCGTGFGISLSANAVSGIRAVCCSDIYTAEYTRKHNNANIISVGACVVGPEYAIKLIDKFLNTPFDGGRHQARLNMVEEIKASDTTITGKERFIRVNGRTWRYLNQRSREWTHLYEYNGSGGTLTTSGCGIFSTCHAVEFFSGERISVEELADFSCSVGGRGEDGTNRPMLLKGMVEKGLAAKYGFRYDAEHINFDDHEGHLNDHEALWDCLMGGGCALTNIRRGHIVNLIACRTAANGERQVLVLDCHSESADDRVKDRVREVLPNSAIRFPVYNESGVMTGINVSYGAFWVPLFMPMDFDLLYKV